MSAATKYETTTEHKTTTAFGVVGTPFTVYLFTEDGGSKIRIRHVVGANVQTLEFNGVHLVKFIDGLDDVRVVRNEILGIDK